MASDIAIDLNQLIQEFIKVLTYNIIGSLNTVAAAALLAYDVLLTLGEEIDLIWRSSWSFINVVHVLLRYYCLAYLLGSSYVRKSPAVRNWPTSEALCYIILHSCDISYPYQIWGAVVVVPAADILVLMRIYALYNQNTKIGIFLVFLWIAEIACLLGFIITSFSDTGVRDNPLPGILPGCFPKTLFKDEFAIQGGSIAIAIQGIYLALTLNVLFRRVRTSLTPMLQVFFRDAALYCTVILVMYLVNILFLVFAKNSPLQTIGQVWLMSLVAVSAGRLVLNLRGSVSSGHHSPSSSDRHGGNITSDDVELGHFTSVFIIDSQADPLSTQNSVPPRDDTTDTSLISRTLNSYSSSSAIIRTR